MKLKTENQIEMTKTVAIWIGIGLIIIAIASVIIGMKINQYKKTAQLQAVELAQMKDSVLTYVTKNGQLISKVESIEVDKRNLKESLEIMGIEKQDLRDQNIKLKNLVSALQMEIQTFGEGQTNVIDTFYIVKDSIDGIDTLQYQKVKDWTDTYLTLFDAKIENKKLDFKYTYLLNMDLLVDKPKNKIVVTANIHNPNIESMKATSVTVSTKLKWYEKPWVWAVAGFTGGILIK